MEKHSLENSLPCVTVDRELLTQIEDYVRGFLNERFHVKTEIIDAAYETTICKRSQKSTFGLVANHDGILFPNEITKVEIALAIPQRDTLESSRPDGEVEIEFNLTLSRRRGETEIYITVTASRPEEAALNLLAGIRKLLEQKSNRNFLYHPDSFWSAILFIAFLLWSLASEYMAFSHVSAWRGVLISGVILTGGWAVLRRLQPYCSFDTQSQRQNDKTANVILIAVLLASVINIVSSFYPQLF